ncbi:DUF2786 domain-containing protein [Aestuariimicrobium ganziense]|uniref:DUF2786 domain-containing protein n=1 Tax=Aestuariimicrobium ganziense TaxID=2773677 RepID=UPI0019451D09|nr:DUF2786 domain-containing protein [Aestuariimicrobium ganziense]
MTDKIVATIGKLLRKAETTDSVDEAEALMAKAQALATRHAIDLAVARFEHSERERREGVEERVVTIGRPRQPHLVLRRRLFGAVAEVNDVTVLLRGTEATLYPIGFPSDLDVVEAIYRSLEAQMTRAADEWIRRSGTPLHTTQARTMFYEGFVARIHARLVKARDEALWQADPGPAKSLRERVLRPRGDELSSTALALRAKRQEVDDFIRTSYPRLATRTTRARVAGGHAGRRAHEAGRTAADRARISGQRALPRDQADG